MNIKKSIVFLQHSIKEIIQIEVQNLKIIKCETWNFIFSKHKNIIKGESLSKLDPMFHTYISIK